MSNSLVNMFKIEELRKKILWTFLLLVVFRVGAFIPIPGAETLLPFSKQFEHHRTHRVSKLLCRWSLLEFLGIHARDHAIHIDSDYSAVAHVGSA